MILSMQKKYPNKKINKIKNDDSSNVLLREFASEKHQGKVACGSIEYNSVYVNEVILWKKNSQGKKS